MAEKRDNEEGNFLSHLLELRNRLLYSVIVLLLAFVALWPMSERLYELLAMPLLSALPAGTKLIAIDPYSPLFAPLKLTFATALVVCMPYFLYQLWAFVAPGLYKREKKMVVPLLVSTTILFYSGMAFAYFLVLPTVYEFMVSLAPAVVNFTPDIRSYLDSSFTMFFAFGIAFEVPVVIVLLVRAGIIDPHTLSNKRPYFVVGAFAVAMLLTPPDPFSQVMLAVPLWILFEAGLFIGRRIKAKAKDKGDTSEEELEKEMDEQLLDSNDD